jgi:pyruvate dehydrogenase E2 component (dihydrolipoamide acetyltransferase)
MEVEAFAEGFIRELLVEEGQMANAMTPIAIVTSHPDEPYNQKSEASRAPSPHTPPRDPLTPPKAKGRGFVAAPSAVALGRELGLDLSGISGTGPDGFITRNDVQRYAARPAAAVNAMAGMAALTRESVQTIPHFLMTADLDVSAAEEWRKRWNAANVDLPATLNDVFIRAAAKALQDVPRLNLAYADGRYEQRPTADVLVIVAMKSGRLALVPVAEPGSQSWRDFLGAIRNILEEAKHGRLKKSHELGSPLLAISNLGMHGVKEFTAIIPLGCTAVLAIGAVRDSVVVSGGQIRVGRLCTVTLSSDHRVIDGITAADFLKRMQERLNSL